VAEKRSTWQQIVSAALLPLAAGALLISACSGSSKPVEVTNTTIASLAGRPGNFDVVEIDQAGHRLYAADRSDQGVDVFDTTAAPAKYLLTIPLAAAPNGLAIAPSLSRLYVGAANGSVLFVDINSTSGTFNKVVKEVKTGGKDADLIDYAAGPQLVFASTGLEGTIASIDANTGEVKGNFKVGFALEQPRYNPADKMLYVTSPDADGLFQLDPTNGTIKNKVPLGGCLPAGMAINGHSQVLIACRSAVIMWDLNKSESSRFDRVAGGDIVSYSAKADRFLVGAPAKIGPSAVGVFGGSPVDYIAAVSTPGAGKSAAYDETNDVVYTPDGRAGYAGLAWFHPPVSQQFIYPSVASIGIFAAVVVVILLLFVVVGRGADPVLRVEPEPRPRRSRSTST
jgi:sugar lactone lactonase YvrE